MKIEKETLLLLEQIALEKGMDPSDLLHDLIEDELLSRWMDDLFV